MLPEGLIYGTEESTMSLHAVALQFPFTRTKRPSPNLLQHDRSHAPKSNRKPSLKTGVHHCSEWGLNLKWNVHRAHMVMMVCCQQNLAI